MELIRLHVLPPSRGARAAATLVIASPATRIVKCIHASPWEVFLRPDHAARIAIHYYKPKPSNTKGRQ